MSETRTPLGSLASFVNEKGEEELTRRAGREFTPMDRHTIRMHEQREQAWRPLNKHRVASFIRLFILCLVEFENGHRVGRVHPVVEKMLKKALAKRIIPFICRRLVYTMDESSWMISLPEFKELNDYLLNHLPRVHGGEKWQEIAYFFKEVEQQRKEEKKWLADMEKEAQRELTEEEAGERNYQQYRQTEEYHRDRDIC